jgi:hypothetical protein
VSIYAYVLGSILTLTSPVVLSGLSTSVLLGISYAYIGISVGQCIFVSRHTSTYTDVC